MSAFKRRLPTSAQQNLPGVRLCALSPFHPIMSTGVPSLDDVLGGGLPLSTSLLVQCPDSYSAWTLLVQKYFISQGLRSGHDICLVGDTTLNLNDCMWVHQDGGLGAGRAESFADDDRKESAVKIAWRYEGMKPFNTTVSHKSEASSSVGEYCSDFDLTRLVPNLVISEGKKSGRICTVTMDVADLPTMLSSTLSATAKACAAHAIGYSDKVNTALRISVVIPSLLDTSSSFGQQCLVFFMHKLRQQIRGSTATALITLPPHLSSSSAYAPFLSSLVNLSDAALTLISDSLNPLSGHRGVLQLNKLPAYKSLVSPSDRLSALRGLGQVTKANGNIRGGGENNLAFRCRRRAFFIETLNLDVEGGVGERRTAPPILYSAGDSQAPGPNSSDLVEVHPISTAATAIDKSGKSSVAEGTARRKVAFSDAGALYDF